MNPLSKPAQVKPVKVDGLRQQVAELTPQISSFADDLMQATAPNTRRAYGSALRMFQLSGYSLPATAEQVAGYVRTACAWQESKHGLWVRTDTLLSASTVNSHIAAISFAHRLAGFDDPTRNLEVVMALKAVRKTRGTDPAHQAKPLLQSDIFDVLEMLEEESRKPEMRLAAIRDAALFVVGWTGAFRRSELAQLNLSDVRMEDGGMVLRVRQVKRKENGFSKPLMCGTGKFCPIALLLDWVKASGQMDGLHHHTEAALFRGLKRGGELHPRISTHSVNDIVKRRCEQAGIDMFKHHAAQDTVLKISAHSLRAGFVTEMRKRNVEDWRIQKITGHEDPRSLNIYNREGELFADNCTDGLW